MSSKQKFFIVMLVLEVRGSDVLDFLFYWNLF